MYANTQERAERLRNAKFAKNAGFTSEANENKAEDIFDEFEHTDDVPIWEQPIPFDSLTLPSFPVNELPVIFAEYVRAVAETTQTAPDMAATASLAVLALSLQGKFMIEGKKDWREPLNLYTAIVAKPSELKSAIMALMSEPVKSFEAEQNKKLAPLIEENRIERNVLEKRRKSTEDKVANGNADKSEIRAIAEEINEFEEIKSCRLYCDDITPEKLAGVLCDNNGKTAIISSEGGIFDILAGRYSDNANIETFLKAHSGDPIRVDRQGRASENIDNPALTTLIFTQPAVIENMMSNSAFRGRGLCARFLYSVPVSKIGGRHFNSRPIPETTKEIYCKLVKTLLGFESETPRVIRLSEKATEIFQAFYEKTEQMLTDELSAIEDWAGKFRGAVLRIAGLLYIGEQVPLYSPMISGNPCELILHESFMQSAIIIGEYYLEHAKKAYQLMGSDEVTE